MIGNNIMTRYAYDPKTFRVLRQRSALYKHSGHTYTPNAGIRQDLQYTYDLEGTITTTNDAAPANKYAQGPGNLLRKFNHDPLRRLISATGREISNVYQQPSWDLNIRPEDYTATNTYTRSYQYDKLGNIQYLSHKATGHANQNFDRDFTYDGTDNKLRAFTVNSNLFQNKYDPSGNLAQEGQSRFYEWTANDKMTVFKNQAGRSTPSVFTNYFYNAQGERIKKHTQKGNKLIVTFYMDGGMFETSYVKTVGGGIDSKRYYNTIKISDEGALIATIRVGENVDDHTPAIKYIVGDHLNNSTAVLTTSGSLINREEFYPFGETSFGGFQYKRYRYNGKERDDETGLYNYGARYYAPWLCRFISVDPAKEQRAWLTPYNYVQNNPINLTDPTGALDDGGGDPVKKGDVITGDDGKKYTMSIDEVVVTGVKPNSSQTNTPLETESGVQKFARETITEIAETGNNLSGGRWSEDASSSEVDAFQLFYQWVCGEGQNCYEFNANSTMGSQMLSTNTVQDAITKTANKAAAGNTDSSPFARSLSTEFSGFRALLYPIDFYQDVSGDNPARGFHGSFAGNVHVLETTPLGEDGGAIVKMLVQITEKMTAISGTRASSLAKGYGDNPTAIYTSENPYGSKGQFRTIEINYNLEVTRFVAPSWYYEFRTAPLKGFR